MDGHVEVPAGLETVPIPDDGFSVVVEDGAVFRLVSHPGIKRDARLLLTALGEVERDLQGTMDGQWVLALRSSLSVVVQHDGRGTGGMATIDQGLDPDDLPPGALEPATIERTLRLDAMDQVAHATHWLLRAAHISWPRCPAHSEARVVPCAGIWVCEHHDLAPIGQLAPPPPRKRLRSDGTVEELDG